ncbi:MAG: RDD family protein, partial [Pyrinomonadaceae bacterium]
YTSMTAVQSTALQPTIRSRAARKGGKRLHAPFSLRCGALLIDYIVIASIVVLGTLIARMLGGGAKTSGSSAETVALVIAAVVAVLDLGILPGLTGVTIGKWATGLRIEQNDGRQLGIGRALIRHFIGYPISFLLFGIGFVMPALTMRGRGLHDIIAGTVVVREGSVSPHR